MVRKTLSETPTCITSSNSASSPLLSWLSVYRPKTFKIQGSNAASPNAGENHADWTNLKVVVDGYTDASQDSYAVDNWKGFNGGFTAAVGDEQIGFMNTEGTSGKVVRINMSEPLNAAVLDTGLGVSFRGGFSAGDYGYLVPYEGTMKYGVPKTSYSPLLTRFRISTFSDVETFDLTTVPEHGLDLRGFSGGFASAQHGYILPAACWLTFCPGLLVRWPLNAWGDASQVQTLDLKPHKSLVPEWFGSLSGHFTAFTFDTYTGGFVLDSNIAVLTSPYTGQTVRISMSDFTVESVVNLAAQGGFKLDDIVTGVGIEGDG